MNHLIKLLCLVLILVSCQTGQNSSEALFTNVKDDFSSPKSLFVDHISSFTGGVISATSKIRLRLNRSIPDSLIGTSLKNIFSFSPTIKGSTIWEDNKTIIFQPASNLSNNTKYEVTANLKYIIPSIDKKKEEFKFIFQTLLQNYEVNIRGLKLYDRSDLTRVKIEGQIQTADVVALEDVEKMVSASQSGNDLALNWETGETNTFLFTIENVERTKKANEVSLRIDGKPIEVDKEVSLDVEIPATDNYKVVSSQIIRGKENYISVLFSDPLDTRQNLTGLVSLTNTRNKPRLVIDLNELKIYPTQEVTSTVTLNINQGLKNIAGYGLKKDYATELRFSQILPSVRLVNSEEKTILPNSSGLVLPFEAVGLSAVDVTIIKIFEDNMQQYLQVNNLGGQSQLSRVGRPVAKKVVPLNTSGVTNLNSWSRFTLDLEDLLKTEPGSVYQIRIGFRRSYSLYFCADNDQIVSIDGDDDEWGQEEEEDSYWDSYDYYYNSDYDWGNRDNPCSNSYYGSRRSVNKMLLASDFGIIAKKRDGGDLSVFLTNLVSTEPINGVTVEVYDYQQQLISSVETDQSGIAKIKSTQTPYLIVAKKGNQVGYLKINDGSSLSLSNFDITGTKIQKGLKGFIYGERGVWRPADTVHLGFILQDIEKTLPENHPVILELYNPNSQLSQRKISSEATGNIYRFDFITDRDVPTGNWRAVAKVGGASFEKTIKIETIKPNRLKINLTFDKERFSANDQSVSGDLNVRWLTGAKAGNLKAEYELLLKAAKTTFKEYPNFSFDDQAKEFYSSREIVFEGRVNDEGFTKINLDLGDTRGAPGALTAMLFGKVYEEGGDFSISNTSIPYFPYESFVGLKTPEGDKRGILLTDEDHSVRIATVDAEGNPVSRKRVKVKLFKLNWKWWWDNSYEYLSNYVGRSYRDPIASGTINATNGEGNYKLRINHPEWGRYYLQVEDPVSGHTAGKIVYLDWPGWAGKGKRGELDGATMLDFGIEKEEYKVGDQIALSIPSTKGNKILVSLETGSEIIQTFWVNAKEENTTISFEATPGMSPNIYAHLTMIQPHGQTANDLPIRLYGVQSIKVVDADTELNPEIKSPSELRPGQNYTIEVSEEDGKAMAYTIAIVDEGLLDITNFKTPQPWNNFYAREALGIKTWDVYDDVMGSFAGKTDRLLAIGGDGEIQPVKEENEANRFKPVVQFLGPFYLKSGDSKKHNIKMPQYIGSVKTMVIAAADDAFGHSDITTPVKQSLMVLATLPRVTGPGESMKLPVNIFVLGDQIKNVNIAIEASGALMLTGAKSAQLQFKKAGDKVLYFDLKAKEILGVGKVKVIAKSGSTESVYDIEMNVIPRNPVTSDIADKVVANGQSWDYEYSPIGILGENTGYIEISSLPPLNIESRLGYLIRYPHGCIEQTTSSVFSQLFLNDLVKLSEDRKDAIQRNIDAAIKRLKSFQLSNGGFSYWPGNQYANNWGSNYAGHFLLEAKKAGYAVPEGMLSSWIGYQTSKAESWGSLSTDDNNDMIQAYRLYTLAVSGSEALGAMNRMKESDKISRKSKWRLALTYAAAGYDTQAQSLIEGLSTEIDDSENNYRYTFGSNTRDHAMILETLMELDQKEKAFEILMDIAQEMGSDTWMSTQTTAYCFVAIAKYTANFGVDEETNVDINISGNIKKVTGNDFAYQIALINPDEKTMFKVSNNGDAPVFARVISTGIPMEGDEKTISRNINFKIDYRDMRGTPVNVSTLKQGMNFKAEITVTNPGLKGEYVDLALTQIFPSGWEIINTRLDGSESADTEANYMDIRDDRVMHYFDLKPNKKATFTVLLNAAYQGSYYLPSINVEAMYDNSIFANRPGRWVTVEPDN